MVPSCSITRLLMTQCKEFSVDMSARTSQRGFSSVYSLAETIFAVAGQNFWGKGLAS